MGNLKAKSLAVALGVMVSALALSSAAYAAGKQNSGGGSQAVVVQSFDSNGAPQGVSGSSATEGNGQASVGSSSGLPFTSLDLVLTLGGGAVLIASGLALSQVVTRRARI